MASGTRAAAYLLHIEGQKSGKVKGGSRWKGKEDAIELMHWQHSIISPRDPQSGLPTGKRMHRPIEVLGKYTKAMPIMFNMLATNENIKKFTLEAWSQHGQGSGTGGAVFYTIELENANIATFDHVTSEVDGTLFFRATFTYQKITLTWKDGGITATDDWESPNV